MRSILLILLLAFSLETLANKPAPLVSQLREIKPRGWYEQQYEAWQLYLRQPEVDASAADWLEFFRSARLAGKSKEDLTTISEQLTSTFEHSFEDLYAQYLLTGWTDDGIELLRKSLEIQTHTSTLADRLMLAEFDQEYNVRQHLGTSLFHTGIIYPSLMNYSYNVLMSVADNGVLFVQGKPTTIPLWILQDEMGVRQDVKILNLDLAGNGDYVRRWAAHHGLSWNEGSPIEKLPENNPEVPFFYGLTLPGSEVVNLESQLYVVGLASYHDQGSFDHFGTLRKNIEDRFLLDYLSIDFQGEPRTSTGKVYESNYILPFLLLKELYDELDDTPNAQVWENQILELAERSQIKNRVAMLMARSKTQSARSFPKVELDVKELDKNFMMVGDNVYASRFELTNRDYWFYLNYLSKHGFDELYRSSIVDMSKYDELTASFLKNYHYSPANYTAFVEKSNKRGGGDYLDYPAVDMSFEAAKAYCEWLTVQYNQQEGRKYQKVLFRLPTQREWSVAALGYKAFQTWNVDEVNVKSWGPENWSAKSGTKKNKNDLKEYNVAQSNILYPWWYPNMKFASSITNQFDCYLANVKTSEEIACGGRTKGDGFTLMSPVGSYFANQMGLYDMAGNIAEMVDYPGRSMGGSWNHLPKESTIKSVNPYDGSDIAVGFRLFMEVIEQ